MDNHSSKGYQKYTLILLIVTVAALVVCAAAFTLKRDSSVEAQGTPEQSYTSYYSPKQSPSQENAESTVFSRKASGSSAKEESSAAGDEEYLVTVYNGKIGVFREGEASPFLTADTDVYLLPEEDIRILRRGIRVTGFSAVKSVLEDYE